jgi:RNA polymerase sigma-70 factor, ECF subfamily
MGSSVVRPSASSDAELLASIAGGDERAIARLYDAYARAVFALAFRITGTQADAEEVVQETFAQVWRDAASYDGSRATALTWLVMIARSRALDRMRKHQRGAKALDRATTQSPYAPPAMAEWTSDPADGLERTERERHVAAAVHALPSDVRQIVELGFFEGLSHSEIAERLGLPLGTVKSRMCRAFRLLRGSLRDHLVDWAT